MDMTIDGVITKPLTEFKDKRGWLVELFRTDELLDEFVPAMAYVSMTSPGVTRGPHEHENQADLFCFIGPSTFRIYLWDNRSNSSTYRQRITLEAGQDNPMMLIVPKGVVHAYRNIGQIDGLVFNAPNQLYAGSGKSQPVDEIRHEDDPESEFVIDK